MSVFLRKLNAVRGVGLFQVGLFNLERCLNSENNERELGIEQVVQTLEILKRLDAYIGSEEIEAVVSCVNVS